MKLFCDEGIDRGMVEALRQGGQDVAELAPGPTDERVSAPVSGRGSEMMGAFAVLTRDKLRIRKHIAE